MRLIIVRHGETVDNVNKIVQGHMPGKLTRKGLEQAKKLGERFKDTKIDAIYSSDLKRAMDTANEILVYHPNLELLFDERIRERNMGPFEGKPWPRPKPTPLPEGVESNDEVFKRVKEFLDDIYKKYKNDTVVVVSHGGTKKAFLTILHNKSPESYSDWPFIKNTSVSDFTINEDGKHTVHTVNCTSHLD